METTALTNALAELKAVGESAVGTLSHLVHETRFRRILLKNDEGHVLVDVPLLFGLIGAALKPRWAATATLAALAAGFTLFVEGPPEPDHVQH